MSFLQNSVNLFTGKASAHMGVEQYVDHKGIDKSGASMSGASLWAKAESTRVRALSDGGSVTMANAELVLAKLLAHNARSYVSIRNGNLQFLQRGISVIDYGPGTIFAFSEKTLPLVKVLKGDDTKCILVDKSTVFLSKIKQSSIAHEITLDLIEGDIFSGRRYLSKDEPAFIVMFGRTFGNLIAPLRPYPPELTIINALEQIANGADICWLAISIGSDLNEEKAKQYYEAHPDFQLNIFYRMQAELDIDKNFDPEAFQYEAKICRSSEFLQVAHTAVLKRSLEFSIAGNEIYLLKGQSLHLKNSFSFSREFFQKCAKKANLTPIDLISDFNGSNIHVFEKQHNSNKSTYKNQKESINIEKTTEHLPSQIK